MYSSAKKRGVGCESASRKRTMALAPTIPASRAQVESAKGTVREETPTRRVTTSTAATFGLSAAGCLPLKRSRARSPAPCFTSCDDRCYGPAQAVVVRSPPGPCLYQDFVPTELRRQYETVFEVPRMTTFLTPWS